MVTLWYPSSKDKHLIIYQIKQFLNLIQQNIEKDFQDWITDHFILEKNILYNDFLTIFHDTFLVDN